METVFSINMFNRSISLSRSLRNLVNELGLITSSSGTSPKIFEGHIIAGALNNINIRNGIGRFQQQVFEHAHRTFRHTPVI